MLAEIPTDILWSYLFNNKWCIDTKFLATNELQMIQVQPVQWRFNPHSTNTYRLHINQHSHTYYKRKQVSVKNELAPPKLIPDQIYCYMEIPFVKFLYVLYMLYTMHILTAYKIHQVESI